MFDGALTAIVTPFRDGDIDERALRELVEFQIEGGIDGLVPCGSTGESATLTHSEHEQVIKIIIEQTRRRVPVIACTASNSTAEAIRWTVSAREAGVDGALLISPYYNKPPRTASSGTTRRSRRRSTCRSSSTTSRAAPPPTSRPRPSPGYARSATSLRSRKLQARWIRSRTSGACAAIG